MAESKLETKGYAMLIFYFLSLDKPEFIEFARQLATKTTLDQCHAMAWEFTMGYTSKNADTKELISFLIENCERNRWNMDEWLKTQTKGFTFAFKTEFLILDIQKFWIITPTQVKKLVLYSKFNLHKRQSRQNQITMLKLRFSSLNHNQSAT